MELRSVDVGGDSYDASRDSLFDCVSRFRFFRGSDGRMRSSSVALGTTTVAEVLSNGHEIGLEEFGRVSILFPVSAEISVRSEKRTLASRAGGAVQLWPGFRTTSAAPRGEGRFRALVALGPRPHGERQLASPGLVLPNASAQADARGLRGLLEYILREAGHAHSPLARPASEKAFEALVLDALEALFLLDAAPPHRDQTAGATHVRRAVEFMREHADEPLRVQQIADVIGVGSRVLHSVFRDQLGTTPRAMLADIRMERARQLLLCSDAATTVTDVALGCGFAHLGRFAAAYKTRYDEAPSQTLRRALPDAG
jgi:AraC-like DNA-binding protein